jgi:hypothetical protein
VYKLEVMVAHNSRQWRRFLNETVGRRRADRLLGMPEPKYRRPSYQERLAMWRWAGLGASARQIGRHLRRDHHTVSRHLQQDWGEALALDLALTGRRLDAREMVARLGSHGAFAAQVEEFIRTYDAWRQAEGVRVASLTPPVQRAV